MDARRRLTRPLTLALLVAAGCSGPPPIERFDAIVDRDLLAAAFARDVDLEFDAGETGEGRFYEARLRFVATDPAQHFAATVRVAPAGRFLDAAEHAKRLEAAEAEIAERGDAYRRALFPEIGRRAETELLGVGPGGAAHRLAFTTTDGAFDVQVVTSELLPEGVADPGFDKAALARAISDAYDDAG